MNLTGKDVHKAFIAAFPYLAPHWDALPDASKDGYNRIADELNKLVKERNENNAKHTTPQPRRD